jgi:hypothetical protein
MPYSDYILAPSSRTLFPSSICQVNGSVSGVDTLTTSLPGSATFDGNSSVTFDFGKNAGGFASVQFANNTTGCVGVTFSESSLWISGVGSDATAGAGIDAPLWFCAEDADSSGVVTADADHDRGAFRSDLSAFQWCLTTEITDFIQIPFLNTEWNWMYRSNTGFDVFYGCCHSLCSVVRALIYFFKLNRILTSLRCAIILDTFIRTMINLTGFGMQVCTQSYIHKQHEIVFKRRLYESTSHHRFNKGRRN